MEGEESAPDKQNQRREWEKKKITRMFKNR